MLFLECTLIVPFFIPRYELYRRRRSGVSCDALPSFQRRATILLLAPRTRNQVILWPGRPQSSCANLILPLCLKTLIFAPDSLAPKISDVWFSSSLIIRSPLPTRVGMFAELVANPIPNTIAAGLPTNLATRASNSL